MKKYKLGVAIPYYRQNMLCEQLFNYLKEIIDLQMIYDDLYGIVKVLVYENDIGLSAARNRLMEALIPECEYITFIDADDRISVNFLDNMVDSINNYHYDLYITDFFINQSKFDYEGLKNHVTGIAYRSELIKGIRFNENRNIAEDMEFNNEVRKLNPTMMNIPCAYYYNYGANKDCLSYRYARDEIGEFIEGSDVKLGTNTNN